MNRLFILLQYCLPQHLLSRLLGRLALCRIRGIKNFLIRIFIKRYRVDLSEAQRQSPEEFTCFNDFFTRHLKEGIRPVDQSSNAIVSPVDGAISAFGDIESDRIFQAKGKHFTLQALLGGDPGLSECFHGGKFATIYLAPRDYHRIHMPLQGTLREMTYIPGKLFSVNQVTAAHIDRLFARNERAICVFETGQRPMALVLVGAMIVAGIETVWAGQVAPGKSGHHREQYQGQAPITISKGEEMGLFKLGSTVIMLFPPDSMQWSPSVQDGSRLHMGQQIGILDESGPV